MPESSWRHLTQDLVEGRGDEEGISCWFLKPRLYRLHKIRVWLAVGQVRFIVGHLQQPLVLKLVSCLWLYSPRFRGLPLYFAGVFKVSCWQKPDINYEWAFLILIPTVGSRRKLADLARRDKQGASVRRPASVSHPSLPLLHLTPLGKFKSSYAHHWRFLYREFNIEICI